MESSCDCFLLFRVDEHGVVARVVDVVLPHDLKGAVEPERARAVFVLVLHDLLGFGLEGVDRVLAVLIAQDAAAVRLRRHLPVSVLDRAGAPVDRDVVDAFLRALFVNVSRKKMMMPAKAAATPALAETIVMI